MLKIIGGRYKGRKIEVPECAVPTKNQVREAIFDILNVNIINASFLDLFSGSGAVGLEAYSRGASKVILNDANKVAFSYLKKNKGDFDVDIYNLDAKSLLKKLGENEEAFDYIFIDPPYKETSLYIESLKLIKELGLLKPHGSLIFEYEGVCPLEGLETMKYKEYHYGRTYILIMKL